eukprot:SAG31_NODE_28627_length_407_cov_1.081169_1_plen_86_part_01
MSKCWLKSSEQTGNSCKAFPGTGTGFCSIETHKIDFCSGAGIRWLDDCCRPIVMELWAILQARCGYVMETVAQLEGTHPEAVAQRI